MSVPIKYIPSDSRLTTLPIGRPNLWELYKKQEAQVWFAGEVALGEDREHFQTLDPKAQHLIKYILAFFATFDGIVNINLTERFEQEIDILEAKYFYCLQKFIENEHAHMYSLMIHTVVEEPEERQQLMDAVYNVPVISAMKDWFWPFIKNDVPFAERLVAQGCVEGILFQGGFFVFYWLQKVHSSDNKSGKCPGMCQANEFIARDEGFHTEFTAELYKMIEPESKLARGKLIEIVDSCVNLSKRFIKEALPAGLPLINAAIVSQYIEYMADIYLTYLGEDTHYNVSNPLAYIMKDINMETKTNFFEKRVTEYSNQTDPDEADDGFDTVAEF